jgi:hypothetical protein
VGKRVAGESCPHFAGLACSDGSLAQSEAERTSCRLGQVVVDEERGEGRKDTKQR